MQIKLCKPSYLSNFYGFIKKKLVCGAGESRAHDVFSFLVKYTCLEDLQSVKTRVFICFLSSFVALLQDSPTLVSQNCPLRPIAFSVAVRSLKNASEFVEFWGLSCLSFCLKPISNVRLVFVPLSEIF